MWKTNTIIYLIKSKIFIFALGMFLVSCSGSQNFGIKDYKRSESFSWSKLYNKRVYNLRLAKAFFPDDSGMWYRTNNKDGKIFKKIDFKDFSVSDLFDHKKLANEISKITKKEVKSLKLPFNSLSYFRNDSIRIKINKNHYILNLENYSIVKDNPETKNENEFESLSPDGKWIAFARDYNLYIRSTKNNKEYQLSFDGKKNYEYASYYGWFDKMEGENGERPERFSVNWSADSKWLQTSICDLRMARKMYLLDNSIDTLFRPKLLSYYRGSPGDTTMVYMKPVFFDIRKKKQIPINLEKRTHINTYDFDWIEKRNSVLIVDNKRGYKEKDYKLVNLETTEIIELLKETSDTNLAERFRFYALDSRNQFVFSSERSGWNHLYLFDIASQKITALTSGEYKVHNIIEFDRENGEIYFYASGMNKETNPYFQFLCKVGLDDKKMTILTKENANHVVYLSKSKNYFIDEVSTIEMPTKFILKDLKTGEKLQQIEETDISTILKEGWKVPEIFTATARDNKTKIYGAIWKPSNFDPNKKYPIIDHTYTGPHTNVFPKKFEQAFWSNQEIAELGFIVIAVDGMGTYGRSKAFHDVSYKNMGKNLLDHVLAFKQLAKKYSWIDIDRVGIFGHSAGAYDAAHALLEFPDFYKVAVASAGDHDFRMEKAWWPEMYMGWPVDSSYHKVSNITMAHNLKGKLLLVHGALDDNVNPSATFKLAEYLIRADKDFDMLILPSQRHGFSGKHGDYFRKKRISYFIEHLLGEKPIWDYKK